MGAILVKKKISEFMYCLLTDLSSSHNPQDLGALWDISVCHILQCPSNQVSRILLTFTSCVCRDFCAFVTAKGTTDDDDSIDSELHFPQITFMSPSFLAQRCDPWGQATPEPVLSRIFYHVVQAQGPIPTLCR